MRWFLALALAACAPSEPPASAQAKPPPPPAPAPPPAAVTPPAAPPDQVSVRCSDGDEPTATIELSGPEGPRWTTTLPAQYDVSALCRHGSFAALTADTVVVPVTRDRHHDGALGLDRGSGAVRWTTDGGPAEYHLYATASGPEYVLHAFVVPTVQRVSGPSDEVLQLYDARTGAATARFELPGGDRWVALASGIAHSIDGKRGGTRPWVLRRAADPTTLVPIGEMSTACAVDDRLYGLTDDGIVRHTPGLAVDSLTPAWLGDETKVVQCDRHRDHDVVWLSGQMLAVAPHGDIRWTIELPPGAVGQLHADKARPAVHVTPAHDYWPTTLYVDPARYNPNDALPPGQATSPPRGPPPRPVPTPPPAPAPLLEAARRLAGAAPDAPAQVLLWDRQVEHDDGWSEHALVVVEHPDRRGRPTWTATLLRRGNRDDWAVQDDPFFYESNPPTRVPYFLQPDAWHAFERNDWTDMRRRYWHRPTDADLQRLLASNERWDFNGYATTAFIHQKIGPEQRATVVAGDVDDLAWLALTGELPSRHYHPAIEPPTAFAASGSPSQR